MLRRVFLASALLLSCAALSAQTVDFTGVSISTTRVKKVYQNRFFVLGTGAVDSSNKITTGLIGARFGWVQRFGVYAGFEMGVGGFLQNSETLSTYDQVLLAGKRRDARMAVSLGAILRLASAWNLYAGCSMFGCQTQQQDASGKWWTVPRTYIHPAPEVGVIAHIQHVSVSLGGSYAVGNNGGSGHVIVRAGVGYNF